MKKIFTIIAAVAALSLTSCKDFLDINHSPNAPEEEQAKKDALKAALQEVKAERKKKK